MLEKLIKLADRLDKQGRHRLADRLDKLIIALAAGAEGSISITDLMRLKPDVIMALSKAISFDLVFEPDPDGRGNNVKAIPRIHDKWTDGLNLGDVSATPDLQSYMMPGAIDETVRQVEEGDWHEPGADIPWAEEEDVKFAPETLRDIRLENLEKGRQKQKEKRDIDEALSGAVEEVEREKYLPESERSEEAQYYDAPMIPPSGFRMDPEYKKQQQKQRDLERKMMGETEAELHAELVKMADSLDQEGLHDLASDIDGTLKSLSARPAAPLRKLDDDVKKNLIIFVHDADKNTSNSIKGLNELFRRMRYFDFADAAKDLGLDRAVKDMEKTRGALEEAKKRFYEMMHGKKPSKKDLDELFESLVESVEEAKEQNALDFFETQLEKEQSSDDIAEGDDVEIPEIGKPAELAAEDSAIDKEVPAEETEEVEDEEVLMDMEKELEDFFNELDEEG